MRVLRILLTATLALGASATPAYAADSWSIPRDATIVVRGHGYGHGHGMSQYGAEGAARQGLSFRQIVDFYYPGTRWGTARGRVTVLVSADTTDDLVVLDRPGLEVRDTARGRAVPLPDNGAVRWKVARGSGGADRVLFKTGPRRRWQVWRVLDGLGEFSAGGAPVTLVTPSGQHRYRGRLRVALTSGGDRVTVNALALDNYLKGVVPLEMPATWSPQAVRSQAVAARTYAAYERAHPISAAYQICDTTSCQVYGGYDGEHPASNDAVRATAGKVLLSRGEPALTQFGSSSGGWTSAGSAPYLPAQRDPYDGWSGNPVHDWSTTVRDRVIERAWPRVGNLRRIVVNQRDGNGEWGGRIITMTLSGSRGRVQISGDTFRSELGLRSTWLTFSVR